MKLGIVPVLRRFVSQFSYCLVGEIEHGNLCIFTHQLSSTWSPLIAFISLLFSVSCSIPHSTRWTEILSGWEKKIIELLNYWVTTATQPLAHQLRFIQLLYFSLFMSYWNRFPSTIHTIPVHYVQHKSIKDLVYYYHARHKNTENLNRSSVDLTRCNTSSNISICATSNHSQYNMATDQ